jgi:hypothetical protein
MRYDFKDREVKQVIGSEQFTWSPETRSFVGEASELEGQLAQNGWDRLNYQKGEWGFHMRSQRTGKLVWFKRDHEVRDAENDLVSVEFVADHHMAIKLTVFND